MRPADGVFAAVLPPFRMLEPALRRAVELPLFAELVDALPDERDAARRLNAALRAAGAVPVVQGEPGRWWLRPSTRRDRDHALFALAVLVVSGGWHRLKRCAHPGCDTAFLDRTSAATRLRCPAHVRHRSPA